MSCSIKKIEYVFASTEVNNDHFKNLFPEYDFERFEKKVGIKSRYRCNSDENILTLAKQSCEKLFIHSNVKKENIQFLILCTQSPEFNIPTNSCVLQKELGLSNSIGTFDYNLGCSGYIYGLSIAKGLINSGQVENVLLVTSETYSKYIHQEDLLNQLIFSDSSSATLIEKSDEDGINEFIFGTDGSGYEKLIVRNNFFNKSINPKTSIYNGFNKYTDNNLYMDGPSIFNFTIQTIPRLLLDTLEKNNILVKEVDFFILHQANRFLIESIRKFANIGKDKFIIDMENYGNTVSSSIPIALKNTLLEHNNPRNIILCGFGVGLSWSSVLISLNNKL